MYIRHSLPIIIAEHLFSAYNIPPNIPNCYEVQHILAVNDKQVIEKLPVNRLNKSRQLNHFVEAHYIIHKNLFRFDLTVLHVISTPTVFFCHITQ